MYVFDFIGKLKTLRNCNYELQAWRTRVPISLKSFCKANKSLNYRKIRKNNLKRFSFFTVKPLSV